MVFSRHEVVLEAVILSYSTCSSSCDVHTRTVACVRTPCFAIHRWPDSTLLSPQLCASHDWLTVG